MVDPTYQIRVRNLLLVMIYELITISHDNVHKFGKNVSIKWTLMFMDKHIHPHSILCATRILCALSLFGYLNNSYAIISKLMANHGKIQLLYTCWFSILVGADLALIPFETFSFRETIIMLLQFTKLKGRTINPNIIGIIIDMLKPIVRDLTDSKLMEESGTFFS